MSVRGCCRRERCRAEHGSDGGPVGLGGHGGVDRYAGAPDPQTTQGGFRGSRIYVVVRGSDYGIDAVHCLQRFGGVYGVRGDELFDPGYGGGWAGAGVAAAETERVGGGTSRGQTFAGLPTDSGEPSLLPSDHANAGGQ